MRTHNTGRLSLVAVIAACSGGSRDRSDAMPIADGAIVVDGAVADAAPSDAALDDTPNYVFVTAMAFDGDLGGIAGADAICNDDAQIAALPGHYVAWLSTNETDAIDRLAGARGWVRPDGLPFADRPSDMAASKVFYPPVVTEMNTFPPVREVWTATAADGRFNPDGGDCDGWTSADSDLTGGNGTSVGGSVAFTDNRGASASCDTPRSILCFGLDRRAEVRSVSVGRIGFTTRETIVGSAGLVDMDDLCSTEASQAGLEGTYLALVSRTGSPGPERFDTTRETWVRPDGVRLYGTADELVGGAILAPIALTADGETYLDSDVWTGAEDSWPQVGANCDDWTLATETGSVGRSGLTETYEAFSGVAACTESKAIYCLQN